MPELPDRLVRRVDGVVRLLLLGPGGRERVALDRRDDQLLAVEQDFRERIRRLASYRIPPATIPGFLGDDAFLETNEINVAGRRRLQTKASRRRTQRSGNLRE